MVVLAIVCVCLGIGAPVVAPVMQNISGSILGGVIPVAEGSMIVNPAIGSAVSTPLLAILIIAFVLLCVALKMAFSTEKVSSDRDPWACGYKVDKGQAITAATVGAEVQLFLKPIYSARTAIASTSTKFTNFFNATVRGAQVAEGVGDKYIVDAVAAFVSWLGKQAQKIEQGNFRIYIIYIVVALVVFLALAVGLR